MTAVSHKTMTHPGCWPMSAADITKPPATVPTKVRGNCRNSMRTCSARTIDSSSVLTRGVQTERVMAGAFMRNPVVAGVGRRRTATQASRRRQLQPQLADGDHCLCAVSDVERTQDCADVDLYRALRQIQATANEFVGFALYHQRQHLCLTVGQSQVAAGD